jgi:carboxyl-terminal processing protease
MSNLKKKTTLWLLSLVVMSSTVFFAFKHDDRLFEIAKNIEVFVNVYKEVNGLYVDEINPTRAMRIGIEAMLKELDPYTVFYPEDMIEEYLTMNVGTYNGIGANIDLHQGKHIVEVVYEGSPADKMGIKVGDEIQKINGVDVIGRKAEEFGRLLKGQKGSTVKLSVLKYGEKKNSEISVVRGDIKVNNVPHFGMINEEVGYVQLTSFMNAASGREIRAAVQEMKGKGMKSLILDLRGNPGGLLQLAVEINNFFLPKGIQVVEMKGRAADQNHKFLTERQPEDTDMPLVILIDAKSASASEIVSGALQDMDRAVIIGQRTFGKGLVQITRNLSYNTQVKVTTAKYYIPSGRCVQAIDYGHRNADGSFPKLPDSLRTAFKTKAGRVVYDGAGIDPDIVTGKSEQSDYVKALVSQNMIFDFATKYYHENKEKVPQEGFFLSDAEFKNFESWLKTQKLDYKTPEQLAVEELSKKAENPVAIQNQLSQIQKVANTNAEQLLSQNAYDVRSLLESEILSRYHYQKAMKFASFDRDKDIQAALKLFKNPSEYKAILKQK